METDPLFEDMLELLGKHKVRYLIVGGFAFAFHARPRYTKDIALWIDPEPENIERANAALSEFGSPFSLDAENPREIAQMGVAPNRIDFLLELEGFDFLSAWEKRIEHPYGRAVANWIDIDTLIEIKSRINHPRHQDDVRVLQDVKRMREERGRRE
jgi:hypothetical protein